MRLSWDLMGFNEIRIGYNQSEPGKNEYPLVNIQKAMENGHRNIVDFPIKNGDFPLLC